MKQDNYATYVEHPNGLYRSVPKDVSYRIIVKNQDKIS